MRRLGTSRSSFLDNLALKIKKKKKNRKKREITQSMIASNVDDGK